MFHYIWNEPTLQNLSSYRCLDPIKKMVSHITSAIHSIQHTQLGKLKNAFWRDLKDLYQKRLNK